MGSMTTAKKPHVCRTQVPIGYVHGRPPPSRRPVAAAIPCDWLQPPYPGASYASTADALLRSAGVSRHGPKTDWSASVTSPSVHRARAHAIKGCIRSASGSRAAVASASRVETPTAWSRSRRRGRDGLALRDLGRHRDHEDLEGPVVGLRERVHPHLDQVAVLESALLVERGLGDLLPNHPDSMPARTPSSIEPGPISSTSAKIASARSSMQVGQGLDDVGAAERIDDVGRGALVRDHLLRAQAPASPPPRSGARGPRRGRSCAATGCRRARRPAPRWRCAPRCSSAAAP